MELQISEKEDKNISIIEEFENELKDFPYSAIACKLNLENYSSLQPMEESFEEFPIADVLQFWRDHGCEIKYSVLALHLNGENKKPHLHFNCIVLGSHTKLHTVQSNVSEYRKRWIKKQQKIGNEIDPAFSRVTYSINVEMDTGKPRYSTLSYPLKEGHHVYGSSYSKMYYSNLKKPIFDILLELGTTIYNKEIGLHIRQEKCEERKKNALIELHAICEAGKSNFTTLREMARWLDHNYIAKLPLAEKPDANNYRLNCQKIANELGIWEYSELF